MKGMDRAPRTLLGVLSPRLLAESSTVRNECKAKSKTPSFGSSKGNSPLQDPDDSRLCAASLKRSSRDQPAAVNLF
jgi:hypothetical protein